MNKVSSMIAKLQVAIVALGVSLTPASIPDALADEDEPIPLPRMEVVAPDIWGVGYCEGPECAHQLGDTQPEDPTSGGSGGSGNPGTNSKTPEEVLAELGEDYGCSHPDPVARIANANAVYKAKYLSVAGLGGLAGFLLANRPGKEFTVKWLDGSTGKYHISASNPQFTASLTAENSCTSP